ncbi:hypothetical protein, partial [Aeromonas caviae]|uniref:hypothetical protein n=1 Tax=Aeromonas caviae TaxID=648 RepID=UPI001FC8C5EC
NMMHGDSRVMVVVCLATTSLPAPCLSTSTFPGSREEPKNITGLETCKKRHRRLFYMQDPTT